MSPAVQPKTYTPRLVDQHLASVLGAFPAVLIAGPRATGKTTTARRHARTVVQLDREIEASALRADPDGVLASLDEPVLIDEWQLVPEVLGAVKRLVDIDSRPNRFILTGSARSNALTNSWPATGQVIRVSEWPMTQREIVGGASHESLLDRLVEDADSTVELRTDPVDLRSYVDMALTGGYPEVVALPGERHRRLWLENYVDQLITRDAGVMSNLRDPRRLKRYLQALAVNTAGIVEHKTLYDAAGITRETAVNYDGMLDLMMITEQVPPWSTNRLSRLARSPKRYLTDPSLMVALMGLDARGSLRNGDVLGRLIDTFVLTQIRAELTVSNVSASISHARLESGRREIDLVVELSDGRVIGIEVKASSSPSPDDARHLVWLQQELGNAFIADVVFHTGPRPFRLSEGIFALPIATLWSNSLAR